MMQCFEFTAAINSSCCGRSPWEANFLDAFSVSFERLFLRHPFSVAFLMMIALTSSPHILSQGYYIQPHRLFTTELNWLEFLHF